jgi:beta-phosphoglucomutase-like phosphatase (HAD superfamily)
MPAKRDPAARGASGQRRCGLGFSVQALLFDCDGVLVDSHDTAALAWNQWATRPKPGFDFHRDDVHGRRRVHYIPELVAAERAADDVRAGKPAPDPYRMASEQLGFPPDQCAVFEEAPAGVLSARRAGTVVVFGVGSAAAALPVESNISTPQSFSFDAPPCRYRSELTPHR